MKKIKAFLKKFIYESFRKRTIEDYRNLNLPTNETKIPWFYLRILLVGFLTFTIFMFLNYAFNLGFDLYLVFIGGSFMSLAVLFIAYELDNNKELSIAKMLMILIISMTSVSWVLLFISKVWVTKNEYLIALRAGTIEELVKAIYAIIIVYVLQKINKKKFNYGTILIIGLTVGAGFGIAEDFLYMNPTTREFSDVIENAILRGLNAFHGHMVWTGLITYAFFRFKKPFINYRFYLVLFGTMIVHTFWDIFNVPFINDTLYNWIHEIALLIHLVLSMIICVNILIRNNNRCEECEINEVVEKPKLSRKEINNIIIVATIILVLLFPYQYINLDSKDELINEYDTYEYYDTFENFKLKAQGNRNFNIDRNRPYDNTLVDDKAEYEKGQLINAHQYVVANDAIYMYYYVYDKETGSMKLSDITIYLGNEYVQEEYLYSITEDDTNTYIYYDVIGLTGPTWSEMFSSTLPSEEKTYLDLVVDSDENVYVVHTEKEFKTKFYVLVASASLVLIAGAIGLIVYNVKSKKKENNEEIE